MKQNQTVWLILGMLSFKPNMSGYDIRKGIEASVSYFWRESYGQIYPTLKRLAAEGLIVARRVGSKGRPERQEYSLSAKGRARLREWLAEPFRVQPVRSEFLLKLFFGRTASPEVSIQHIKTFQENSRRLLATLVDVEGQVRAKQSGNPNLPFWLLTLSLGIWMTRRAIDWSDHALATFLPEAKPAVRRRTSTSPSRKGKQAPRRPSES